MADLMMQLIPLLPRMLKEGGPSPQTRIIYDCVVVAPRREEQKKEERGVLKDGELDDESDADDDDLVINLPGCFY